jgi:hypothetical protein
MNNWIEARNVCDKVLEEAPTVAKAWFRRGEANFALNDWEIAKVGLVMRFNFALNDGKIAK